MKKNELPLDPLIQGAPCMARKHFTDEYLAIAHNIENALQHTGAVPGKDYSYLDLFKLAQPFVLELCKGTNGLNLEYDFPAQEVLPPV